MSSRKPGYLIGLALLAVIFSAPGVLSIALTNCRQRLGDLVADTIVVNASSINSK